MYIIDWILILILVIYIIGNNKIWKYEKKRTNKNIN